MKIGILVSMTNNFGQKGFYNSQEIGMAKMLSKNGHKTIVYKLLKKNIERPMNEKKGLLEIRYFEVDNLGINGFVNTKILDMDLDKLLYFADTQLSVPKVYKWCCKYNITFIPYVGVTDSHSTNRIIKNLMNILFVRNIHVFRRCTCLAKNNDVKNRLIAKGIKNIKVAPVGIDFDLLNSDYERFNQKNAKEKLGFKSTDRIVLLVGRLDADRNSLDSVEVFKALRKKDYNFKLLIIGKGRLKTELLTLLKQENFDEDFKYIEQIPNNEMWKVYRASEILITFSRTEIFGMSILEAMYYGTIVHAVCAPGPNDILINNENGFLYKNAIDMTIKITDNLNNVERIKNNAHKGVITQFSWNNTAKIIEEYI